MPVWQRHSKFIFVTSREGRVSRNYAAMILLAPDEVTSREGRVSRNSHVVFQQEGKDVTSREGRVSRNSGNAHLRIHVSLSRPARGV